MLAIALFVTTLSPAKLLVPANLLAPASVVAPAAPAQPARGVGDDPIALSDDDDDDDASLARDLERLGTSGPSFFGGIDLSMFMKVSYGYSSGTALLNGDSLSRVSIDDVHMNLDGEIDDWHIHIGLRGEADSGLGFFGDAGTLGTLRAFDILLSREVYQDWWIRAGQFRPPFLGSALYEDNELLFINRTFNGEIWDFYDQGATVEGRWGILRGWASIQNGFDHAGNDYSFTGRGMIDVLGGGTGYENEGALGAPAGAALSLGAAAYYDSNTTNVSAQSLEAHFSLDRFAAEAELVDNGNGLLGGLYSWGATASFLITDTIEVAGRYESFDRNDDTELWRLGINKYISGHAIKWQGNVSQADSHAPRADTTVYQVALVVSL